MAFTRVHHVGLIAPSFEDAEKVFVNGFGLVIDRRRSNLPGGRPGSLPDTTSVEIPVAELYLEIIKPNGSTGEAAQFLADRTGGGFHHLGLASDDIQNDVRLLEQRGVKIRSDQKWDAKGPVFLDPATTLGLQLQVAPSEEYYPHPAYRGAGEIIGMAHIGIAARSYEEVYHLWNDVFGIPQNYSRDRGGPRRPEAAGQPRLGPDDPVWLKEFPLGGCVLEISIPADTESGTARFVAQRGQMGAAFHHIGPYANDVHRVVARATSNGIQQIGRIPEPGQSTNYVAWFHPRTCLGVLVEVWNRPEP
ncbi:MAG: VOC family protein [Chloroflexi bacterium]|nr:VOC family protein [Chloroflexota bacterium]